MADAQTKSAPSKEQVKFIEIEGQKVKEGSLENQYLAMEFEIGKRYVFELSQKNPPREIPPYEVRDNRSFPMKESPFIKRRNIVYTSQIVWNGQRTIIRYYDGCDTLFTSQQPKEKELIDSLIAQTKRRAFTDGKFMCNGDERMLLLYLYICSWNAESPFRTSTADQIFVAVDKAKAVREEEQKYNLIEEALKLAKEATEKKMRIHAAYLGISDKDEDSNNELLPEEIRVLYRKAAINDPSTFKKSFGDKTIEIKYFINRAWAEGFLNNKMNPNKVTMGKNNMEVCDISGLKSSEAICQKIFEHGQTEEGSEFVLQLQAIYS